MNTYSKFGPKVLFTLLFFVSITRIFAQEKCSCSPEFRVVYDQCVVTGSKTQLAVFVHDPSRPGAKGFAKLYANLDLVYEKDIILGPDGEYHEILDYVPLADTKLLLEYHCLKNECYSTWEQTMRTIPAYDFELENVSCPEAANGSIALKVQQGPGMNVMWESGEIKDHAFGLKSGKYFLTVTNSNGCSVKEVVSVEEPAALTVSPYLIEDSSNNQSKKYISLAVSGGTAPYSYDWDMDGLGDMDDNRVQPKGSGGSHSFIVMDVNGCRIQKTIDFDKGTAIQFLPKNGRIYSDITSGNGTYLFDLEKVFDPSYGDLDNDGQNGTVYQCNFYSDYQKLTQNQALPSGRVEAEDNSVFIAKLELEEGVFRTIEIRALAGGVLFAKGSGCYYDDPLPLEPMTTLDGVTPVPGGGTFQILDTKKNNEDVTTQVLVYINGKAHWDPAFRSTAYDVYYTYVENSETITRNGVLTVQDPNVNLVRYGVAYCKNGPYFELVGSPGGGSLEAYIDGNPIPSGLVTSFVQNNQKVFMISPGLLPVGNLSYRYIIPQATGENGDVLCGGQDEEMISILDYPTISIDEFPEQICLKEQINLSTTVAVTSGTDEDVTYQWFFRSNGVTTTIPGQGSYLDIPEVAATGEYIVKVTQTNGCMARDTGRVEVLALPMVRSNVITSANCFGVASAEVEVIIEGISGTDYNQYVIEWKGKKTGVTRFGRYQNDLPADSFFITVTTPPLNTQGLQCSVVDTVVITSLPAIGLACTPPESSVDCFGSFNASRTVTVSPGATTPLCYSLVSKNGPYQDSNVFTGLGVGNDPAVLSKDFKVYVKDANGCLDSCAFRLLQPPPLSCNLTPTDLTCFNGGNGRVDATVTGGVPPYTYKWSNNIVVGPTQSPSDAILGLAAGTYSLTITDDNDCTTACSVTVGQPNKVSVILDPVTVCLDDRTTQSASPSGGSGPYTYEWYLEDAGATGATDSNLTWDTDEAELGFDAWCLKPGEVKVRVVVTDSKGCTGEIVSSIILKSCFDLAIRKTVALPSKQYYPGDSVTFYLDIYNQGKVDALDLTITDILDDNMQYLLSENTTANTGNENSWEAGSGNTMVTTVSSLEAGKEKRLKVVLRIKENTLSNYMVNFAEITNSSSQTGDRIKENPIDEDNYIPETPDSKSTERDDELCDTENSNAFPDECHKVDDPMDEDRLDYAVVTICQLEGNEVDRGQCIDASTKNEGLELNTPDNRAALDPDGNGDGVAIGDNGNLVQSFHNTYMDAMSGDKPITGKIIFQNGSGGNNSSNGILTPQGDLKVFADQEIEIFARLVALDGCIGVSVLTVDFTSTATIVTNPESQIAIVDQENLCFEVETDPLAGITYNYQRQQFNGTVFEDIPGATGPVYCVEKVTETLDGVQFRVLVSDPNDIQNACAAISSIARLELDEDPVLVCNDLVNISLDDNCQVLITPEMVLEAARLVNRLVISIREAAGNPVPNPVTAQYVGQMLTVSVVDTQTGNSCWSKVKIEDKLPPVIVCPEDYNVSCANFYFNPPVPAFHDACDNTATITLISDIKEDLGCNRTDGVIAVRTLTYIAKDKHGNTSKPCIFRVYYHAADIDDIIWPENKIYECTDALAEQVPGTGVTGLPTLYGFPLYPAPAIGLEGYCRINVAYHDQTISLCGNSYKVVRNWTVLDWCRGTTGSHTQLITVKDTKAPELVCSKDKVYEVLMDSHECSADFTVPSPVISYDCNETYWSVSYFNDPTGEALPTNGVYVADNLTYDAKEFIIHDLPAGITWIRYAVVDACDNLEYCYAKIVVKDVVKPTPVCDEYTVISLDAQGRARLFAKTIDDGSHDNCSKVSFGIRRMDDNCSLPSDAVFVANYEGASYYTFVDFCCQDQIENEQQVELLVIDQAGNMNTCMTTVEIQQKVLPVLNCPADRTIDCEADPSPQALNAFASFTSPCPVYYLAGPTDQVTELTCGEKDIKREWQVRENGTNKVVVSCTQNIYIRNLTPFNLASVKFPDNVTLTNRCMNAGDFGPGNPDTGGYPTWTAAGCSQVAVSYTDQVFDVVEDACFKIVRHWTVIDWCTFDLGNPGTIRNHQQIIKVIDTEKPRAICQDVTVNVTEGCSRLVTVVGDGDDTCTPKDQLAYSYSLDGGAVVYSRLFSQNLTVGIHELKWTVKDKCGNSAVCTQIINVRDTKKPTPYCISELVTVLMPTNLKVAIWAKDYNLGAFDNCSTKLRFTFGANSPVSYNRAHYYKAVNGVSVETTEAEYLSGVAEYWDPVACSSARMFSCPDLGLHTLTVYTWDEAGNNDYCTVRIKIQDNSGICGQSRNTIANGTVESIRDLAMEGVVVTFRDDLGGETYTRQTDQAGTYSSDQFLADVPYVVSASRDGDWLNGVSTLDLVMIQRHILGLQPLQDPMLLLAADANADGKVTASDLTDLRKLILGQTTSLPKNKSWIFIHNQEGNEELTPWEMPRQAYFTAQPQAVYTNNFTGIKVGDVNLNAAGNIGENNTSARNGHYTAVIGDIQIYPGRSYRIPVYAGDMTSVMGLQLSLAASEGVTIRGLTSAMLEVRKSDYHIFEVEGKKMVNISWNSQAPSQLSSSDILFEIEVTSDTPVRAETALKINEESLAPEVTDAGIHARSLKLRSSAEEPDDSNALTIFQNVPNPFSDQTSVRYSLPENDEVELTLADVDGKVLFKKKDKMKAGIHEMIVSRSMTGMKSGVFLFTVTTSREKSSIRMIQIE